MPARLRLLTAALAACSPALLLLAASPAQAARAATTNACLYDYNDTWGDIPIWIDGDAAANGRKVTLTGTTVGATLPQWLPDTLAYVTGNGTHKIQVGAWLALAGEYSSEGVQVLQTSGTGTMTVSGKSVSPISVSLKPLADSAWSPLPGGGPLTLRQGGPSALPAVPAGPSNSKVTPKGSVLIRAIYKPLNFRVLIDCQPGTTPNGSVSNSTRFTAGTSQPLASFPFDALPGETPTPVGPGAGGGSDGSGGSGTTPDGTPLAATSASITSTSLKFGSRAVLVRVACPATGSACRGGIRLTSTQKLRIGKGSARKRKLAAGTYSVKPGLTVITKLTLTADGRKLRKKTSLRVRATLKPSGGGASISKTLRTAR